MSADQLVPVGNGPEDVGPPYNVTVGSPTEDTVLVLTENCLQRPVWITSQNDIPTFVLAVLYIIFGILYTLFGYRCFKTVMFLTGFIFGSVLLYLICIQEAVFSTYGNISIALTAGLLFGCITMLVQYVGLFVLGLHSGVLLAVAGIAIASHTPYASTSTWLNVGILMGSAILFALLNLHWPKGLTILGTAVYGGAIQAAACDFMVERFEMVRWIWESVARVSSSNASSSVRHCWFSWFILGLWPLATLTGLCLQCGVTGRGIHHEQTISAKKARKAAQVQQPRTKEQRAEMKQKNYRYLYQIRTAHGDIISQNYVQALQNKGNPKMGTGMTNGESSTLQSDATHVTILPGETGLADERSRDSFGSRYR